MKLGLAVVVVSLSGSLPSLAGGQGAVLEVRVREADSGGPLAGAQVHVEGMEMGGVTDAQGLLRLQSVASGVRELQVRFLGFAPAESAVVVPRDGLAAVEFELARAPIPLEPVRVVARPHVPAQHGFEERRAGGHGTFFTREEIDKIRPRFLSDLLRRTPGLTVRPTRTGTTGGMRGARPRCAIQYYLDGVLTPLLNVDVISPADVEGLEVYRGGATVPPQFNRGTAMCGVVLIWTRAG